MLLGPSSPLEDVEIAESEEENRIWQSSCRKGQHFIASFTLQIMDVIICYCQ